MLSEELMLCLHSAGLCLLSVRLPNVTASCSTTSFSPLWAQQNCTHEPSCVSSSSS